jgi:hypothetical protein
LSYGSGEGEQNGGGQAPRTRPAYGWCFLRIRKFYSLPIGGLAVSWSEGVLGGRASLWQRGRRGHRRFDGLGWTLSPCPVVNKGISTRDSAALRTTDAWGWLGPLGGAWTVSSARLPSAVVTVGAESPASHRGRFRTPATRRPARPTSPSRRRLRRSRRYCSHNRSPSRRRLRRSRRYCSHNRSPSYRRLRRSRRYCSRKRSPSRRRLRRSRRYCSHNGSLLLHHLAAHHNRRQPMRMQIKLQTRMIVGML